MLEFTLVGIPLIFVLISIFEISRGMWYYHTLAHAVRDGTRYAIVHGKNCSSTPNQCQVTVAQIAQRIRDAGVGLMPDDLTVTLSNMSGGTVFGTVSGSLTDLLNNPNNFPCVTLDCPGGNPGNDIVITAVYPFRSAIAMFWPGAGKPMIFGVFNFPATSRDRIQF